MWADVWVPVHISKTAQTGGSHCQFSCQFVINSWLVLFEKTLSKSGDFLRPKHKVVPKWRFSCECGGFMLTTRFVSFYLVSSDMGWHIHCGHRVTDTIDLLINKRKESRKDCKVARSVKPLALFFVLVSWERKGEIERDHREEATVRSCSWGEAVDSGSGLA
jgi:hypothetical protein